MSLKKHENEACPPDLKLDDQHGEAEARQPGVKAAKGKGKLKAKTLTFVEGDEKPHERFQSMWEIKKEDLALKDMLSNKKLFDNRQGKQPLSEIEGELKIKLIREMLSN